MTLRRGIYWMLIACLLALPVFAEEIAADETEEPSFLPSDLLFGDGLSFEDATLEECMEQFGPPLTDNMDQQSKVIALQYEGFLLEFLADDEGVMRIETLHVYDDVMMGPKDLSVDDTLESVQERFGISDEDDMVWYSCEAEDGGYALTCSFDDELLTEYMLYRL